jgi:hypothetical protein
MEITEVRIKLMGDPNDRLKAFCSITLDAEFVVRDLPLSPVLFWTDIFSNNEIAFSAIQKPRSQSKKRGF